MRLLAVAVALFTATSVFAADLNDVDPPRTIKKKQMFAPPPPPCPNGHCQRGGPKFVQSVVCLDPPDWQYVLKYRQGCWWATTSDDQEGPMFRSYCGIMTMPAGTRPYGYRGKVTGKKYTFYFPYGNPR